MKMAFYTNDLVCGNKHLMPWRMVLEVASNSNLFGHQTEVFSGRCYPSQENWYYDNCLITEIEKPYNKHSLKSFCSILKERMFDVVFLPAAWRGAARQKMLLEGVDMPVVWYVPGAYYLLNQVLKAIPNLNLRTVIPYLIQSLYPKKYLVKQMLSARSCSMITASDYTRQRACQAGWPPDKIFTILSGKPSHSELSEDGKPDIFKEISEKLARRPFYLFVGPPTSIRGIKQFFRAFVSLANKTDDVCLVCLFRSDSGTESAKIRKLVQKISFNERIFCVWQSVSKADMNCFMKACYAVTLPFLLVPSEIPLAVIEAAGHGKPVITTGPGGTGNFAEKFGMQVPSGSIKSLSDAMLKLLRDKKFYLDKCDSAQKVFRSHPTWEQVAGQWSTIAQEAIVNESVVLLERVS